MAPLLAKIREADRAMDAYLALLAAKREHVLKQLTGITLLSRDLTADHLGMSTSQLDREVLKGAMPYVDIDSHPRFSVPDILAYIESRRATGRPVRRRKPKKGAANEP